MKIVFISDTHCYLDQILDRIPYDCDVLVHAGDALSYGSMQEFSVFARTLGKIKRRFDHILYVPGNHDRIVEKEPNICRTILKENGSNIHMLLDEELVIDGIKFYGSPYTPEFFGWAFAYFNEDEARRIWNKIPEDTDVLITHGMPYGILDRVGRLVGEETDEHVGCKILLERIKEVKPKIYVGGHLHLQGGETLETRETFFINAAICNDAYNPKRNPVIVELTNFDYPVIIK